jgi:putative ATPase
LSRCRVITLETLSPDDIGTILDHALRNGEKGFGSAGLAIEPDARSHLIRISEGDARSALNNLEVAASLIASETDASNRLITLGIIEKALQSKALRYDKAGEEHYNLISAFHKSLRGSDPDAAIYWLGRMLSAGEDPLYVARRMVRFASEDVGNAEPQALGIALNAMEAFRFLGHPEGELALAQAAAYLATAPKSNRIYMAEKKVREAIRGSGSLPVPLHIRNAPTGLMKGLGYGKGYKYAHDYEDAYVAQDYLPEKLQGQRYYLPTNRGHESMVRKRLEKWRAMRQGEKDDVWGG